MLNDPRTYSLALKIIKDDSHQNTWPSVLRYLSKFNHQEILDLFWELQIRNDIKRSEILEIVNQYILEHQENY
jgi:hypothetical protein